MSATWKKVIVSGSSAELANVNIDNKLAVSQSIVVINNAGVVTQQITGTQAGTFLTGSFSGSFYGSAILNLPDLTQGAGIVPFLYDGQTTATVAVSGAAALTNNYLNKWNGHAFVNSNITDDGTSVTILSAATNGLTVQAGGTKVTGDSFFYNNLTVQGNITVNGTASFINTENVLVKDKFILIASGSSTLTDAGIIAAYGTNMTGSAFYLSSASTGTYGRWAVAYGAGESAISLTPDEFVNTTKINASNPNDATPPTWGSSTNGLGNMWVNSTTSDIYIWA